VELAISLIDMAGKVKRFSPQQGTHLENYLAAVGRYLSSGRQDWPAYRREIQRLETQLMAD
jgi:hypothetical protein